MAKLGRMTAFAMGALLAAQMLPAATGMMPIGGDPITIDSGKLAGTRLPSGVRAYLGVPFAEPPVGALRWAPPKPIRWTGIWNADRKGAECIQVLRPHDINHYFGEEPTSENCLTLNLWAPAAAKPDAKLPVIVFLYGGGYTLGSSGMANYGGEAVAKAGAVFVNFNYRVGAFGFLAHPELSAEQGGHSGNYGLMDQTAALKWVRDNIARFGGDPGKVLIIGQSAGAGSVAAQIFSPMAKGLFRAAVMSSGCNYGNGLLGDMQGLAEAEKTGLQLQQKLGASSLDAMRQIPADRILASQTETQLGVRVEGVRVSGPIIDGWFLPQPRAAALAAGAINRVPIIASYNGDDIDAGMSPLSAARTVADYQRIARQMYGAEADRFVALFPVASDADVRTVARRTATMAGFESSARRCAQVQAALGAPAWIDEYTRKHPYVPGVRIADQDTATIGAYHTADVPYWLGTLDEYNGLRPTRNWTAWDRTLAQRMMGALIAMAATGSPSTPAMRWPAWSKASEAKLILGNEIAVEPLDAARLDWIAAHPAVPQPRPAPGTTPRD